MALQSIISRFFRARAFLVLATLVSLCVSNNVGPSFLPLPVVTNRSAENSHGVQRETTSRLPTTAESDSFRVPMMGQTQKRAAKEPQPQPFAKTQKAGFVFPTEARVAAELAFPIPVFTSALVSPPPGRAPPRSL